MTLKFQRRFSKSFALAFHRPAILAALVIVCCFNVHSHNALAAEPKWPAGSYNYMVVDQDVRDALVAFGRNTSIPMKISDQVAGQRLRGKLPIASAEKFLKTVCDSYGLVWYYDGAFLHVNSPKEIKTEVIDLGPVQMRNATEKFEALGLIEGRFPIRTVGDSRALSVTGPVPYIVRVRETVAAMTMALLPKSAREVPFGEEIKVRVFRGNREGS